MWIQPIATVVLMAAAASGPSPIACNLKALTGEERAQLASLSEKLRTAAASRRQLADGLSFRIDTSAMTLVELARWVDAERRCCPFLDFRITLEREGAGLQLALTGRPGVKEFLQTEFAPHQ